MNADEFRDMFSKPWSFEKDNIVSKKHNTLMLRMASFQISYI